jgi:Vitamin K-dependent gamma-carboxylase
MSDMDEQNVFERTWSAWCRFWFTAADPTPLCLMRIVVGLLTLYVHIAYTFDLVAFFGPDAWVDQAASNRVRLEMPHVRGRYDWKTTSEFQMPQDEGDRAVLRDFTDRIVVAPELDAILLFMRSIDSAGEERNALLRYLKRPVDAAEFEAELKEFTDDRMSADAKAALPQFFQRQVTPEARKNFSEALIRFRRFLPSSFEERKKLLNLFMQTSADDWDAFSRFVNDLRDMPEAERGPYLRKYAEWAIAPKLVYAEGMHTYSPWFHVKDVRFLWLIHGLHLIVIAAFTVGYNTRVTSVLAWLAGLAYIHRAQPYLFGQDTMMNLCLTYLMLSPCGAKWSLDRWMARKQAESEGRKLPPVAPSVSAGFVLRVFQIQYCLMYFSAGLSKLKGESWWNGTALHLCMANPEFSPMHVGLYRDFMRWLCGNRIAWELLGTGTSAFTLLTEVTLPYLVWTKMRPVSVAASLLLHSGIAILMGLSVFSLFMFAMVLCFIPADAINWMFGSSEDRP